MSVVTFMAIRPIIVTLRTPGVNLMVMKVEMLGDKKVRKLLLLATTNIYSKMSRQYFKKLVRLVSIICQRVFKDNLILDDR